VTRMASEAPRRSACHGGGSISVGGDGPVRCGAVRRRPGDREDASGNDAGCRPIANRALEDFDQYVFPRYRHATFHDRFPFTAAHSGSDR
jgi:hypothetical protein